MSTDSGLKVHLRLHLLKVFMLVFCASIAFAAGGYLHIVWDIGGFLTAFGCVGCMLLLRKTPRYENQKRVLLLLAATLLAGASNGPFIHVATHCDPSIMVKDLVIDALSFGFFSGAVLSATYGGVYLNDAAFICSGLSFISWMIIPSLMFGASIFLSRFLLYIGLLGSVGHILLYITEIVDTAHVADLDYVKHAIPIFTSFIAFLVRVFADVIIRDSGERNRLLPVLISDLKAV